MSNSYFLTIYYVVIGLVSLNVMVLIHELGHYVVARLFHIDVDCLKIGFGPEIKRIRKGTTYISFNAIPFGGLCKLDSLSLYSVNPIKRILMYLAGPLANGIYSVVFFITYLLINKVNFSDSVLLSLKQCIFETKMFINAITMVLTGQAKLGEIISGAFLASQNIGQLTAMGFKSGFVAGINTILYLFASVSLSLGVANLLPFPALDGGYILIGLIELISKRTFSEKFYLIVQISGIILLLVVFPIARQF